MPKRMTQLIIMPEANIERCNSTRSKSDEQDTPNWSSTGKTATAMNYSQWLRSVSWTFIVRHTSDVVRRHKFSMTAVDYREKVRANTIKKHPFVFNAMYRTRYMVYWCHLEIVARFVTFLQNMMLYDRQKRRSISSLRRASHSNISSY